MKKIILSLGAALFMCIASAQVSKTIDVATAGSFRSVFIAAGGNKTTTTNLTVTGNINARDVKFMRDSMPALSILDLAAVQIKAYNGTGGTSSTVSIYPLNEMPQESFSFFDTVRQTFISKTTLTSIKLPGSLGSIGYAAFLNCSGLSGTLFLPSSLKTIGNNAFGGCSSINCELTIPNSVTDIGDFAFETCTGFTGSLHIPNSVRTIGDGAFMACSGFTGSLIIPNSVKSIGAASFERCTGFNENLILSNTLTYIGSNAFYYSTGLSGNLIIPNSVTKIDHDAFMGCSGLNGILSIPASVTSIIDGTFYHCSNLKKIIVNKSTPIVIQEYAVENINKTNCELIVLSGSKAAYQAAVGWNLFTHITEAIFVTLDTKGGNPVAPITTTLTNSTITAPDVPVRNGYSFAGWYKEAVCTNAWDFATDIIITPITLYAKWTQNPVNITSREISNFKLYPNPANTTLNLGNLQQNAQISIFSMDGKLMKQQDITTSESNINIEDFPKGVYLLKVNNKEVNMVQKFIKQ